MQQSSCVTQKSGSNTQYSRNQCNMEQCNTNNKESKELSAFWQILNHKDI